MRTCTNTPATTDHIVDFLFSNMEQLLFVQQNTILKILTNIYEHCHEEQSPSELSTT